MSCFPMAHRALNSSVHWPMQNLSIVFHGDHALNMWALLRDIKLQIIIVLLNLLSFSYLRLCQNHNANTAADNWKHFGIFLFYSFFLRLFTVWGSMYWNSCESSLLRSFFFYPHPTLGDISLIKCLESELLRKFINFDLWIYKL